MSAFNTTHLGQCDSCPLEIANDEATDSGWTHVTKRTGTDPERWEYETYSGDDLHDAYPAPGSVAPFGQAAR
jgi:hypothetical protein